MVTIDAMSERHWSRREVLAAGAVIPATTLLGTLGVRVMKTQKREREVQKLVAAQPTTEGAGVHLNRSLGSQALNLLDPFLLLDEFHTDRPSDYLAGFPTHPHRGFETVTYMVEGAFEHRDILGNQGVLRSGSAQWMTAGHGIVHSEMPAQRDGLLWGFQLWVNLPASHKLMKPRYQDIPPERLGMTHLQDAEVRLVAGELGEQRGPVEGIVTAPLMMDVKLPRAGRLTADVPADHNAFVYVMDGSVELGTDRTRAAAGTLAVLGKGDALTARAADGGRFLLVAGRPIGEPVARYGPFVMNTRAELQQAVDDYNAGRLVEM
jgi:redox-sensitive bicupin YhaK (pirin superfamily)